MPTSLPASTDFTGAAVTEGGFKSAISSMRAYLAGLFGTDGALGTALATLGAPCSGYVAKTTTYAVVAADKGKVIDCTGTWTLSLLAAATAGDGFNVTVRNSGSGVVTVDPNLTETVDGGSTLAINAGESLILYCNGTLWVSIGKSSGTPSGVMAPFAGSTTPSGWLLCDGSAVSRTTYASLFTAISTTYGVGDGSSTFNLPDLRGRVVAGKDNMGGSTASRITSAECGITGTTLGAAGGVQSVTLTAAQSGLPSHSHTVPTTITSGSATSAGLFYNLVEGTVASTVTSNSAGGSAASSSHSSVQPTLIANYIIKT